ncbi:sensor histidine kinase [Planctomonas sp. JC2975]|uniref:sensor histidine kinase n=1 Tax=Planctomonas sp. JC2975 TaxID=2729626 RepID=UPI001F0F2D1B|nr:sensor histidine kinase [Planctomonas sp. JC2975]
MQKRAWWDVAVGVTALACAFLIWLDAAVIPGAPKNTIASSSALAAFVVAYAVFGRWLIGCDAPVAAHVYLGLMTLIVALGCAADPNLSVLQAMAYPLIGCLAPGRIRTMLAWDVVLGIAMFAGLALGPAGVSAAAITASLSFVFAVAIGLWIWRIVDWGAERAHLLVELQAAQNREAAAASDAGAVRERERLARDMHDTVAQSLTGLVMLAERAERQALRIDASGALPETLRTMESAARETLREIRSLVAESASQSVEDGLNEAARRVAARFDREAGIAVDVRFDEVELSREQQVVLLRCLQEALANVRKHASASKVEASLRAVDDVLMLEVVDDGVGVAQGRGDGFGLSGMRDRVRTFGGDVTLESAEPNGARLTVTVPTRSTTAADVRGEQVS